VDPEEKHVLRLYNYISSGLLYVNTLQAKPKELATIKELLNPKWKEKISAYDPRVSGPGELEAVRFYYQLGEEFVRKFYVDQRPMISRDKRQIADWLGRGTYPLSISAETEFVIEMKQQGLPVEMVAPADAPGTLSAGNGLMAMINRAPHPNGARLFVNWMASREGLEILARARHKPTTRNDVDESDAVPWEIPQPGLNYFDAHDWKFTLTMRDKVQDYVKELLKGR
jgi:iron(III) transport system substrate-binding protein